MRNGEAGAVAIVLMATGVFGMAACSGDDEGGQGSTTVPAESELSDDDLIARVSNSAVPFVAFVDVDEVRVRLGLAADADVSAPFETPEEQRAVGVIGVVLTHLARPDDLPLASALDVGQIHRVAGAQGRSADAVTLVETSQDPADLEAALLSVGYAADGETFALADGAAVADPFTRVAIGDDGLVALGTDAPPLLAALDGSTAAPSPAAQAIGAGDAPARVAAVLDGACVTTIAIEDPLDDDAVIHLDLDADADPTRFTLDEALMGRYEFGEAVADGASLEIDVMTASDTALTPLSILSSDLAAGQIYDC